VISSEHLQSCLYSKAEIASLHDELSCHFRRVKIILYIRDPISTAVSSWSTRIKCGVFTEELPPPHDRRISSICDYQRSIESWSEHFGRNNITLRLYHPEELLGGDALVDFFSLVAPQESLSAFDLPARKNESLSALGASILNSVLSAVNVKANAHTYKKYQQVVGYILKAKKDAGCSFQVKWPLKTMHLTTQTQITLCSKIISRPFLMSGHNRIKAEIAIAN